MDKTQNIGRKRNRKGMKKSILKLSLLENAYDYLNCSLEFVVKAKKSDSNREWKFAVINIFQCIELMLKERLRCEHYLLLYSNIDKFQPICRETKTVSWTVLIERLKYILGNEFDKINAGRLELANELRNQIIHFDVELHFPDIYHHYANLLNFVFKFHDEILLNFTGNELLKVIDSSLRYEEEYLSDVFWQEIVFYNGIFVGKSFKEALIESQKYPYVQIKAQKYPRIKWGEDPLYYPDLPDHFADVPCHHCYTIRGQFHDFFCDHEICPNCHRQNMCCACNVEEKDFCMR